MKKSSFKFCWEDTLLEMLPSRALFLPETKELLICDIHLGKAEYFQQNGIPLTSNSDKNNFARIKKIVKKYSCLLYTSPSPRDMRRSRMPSSA